MGDKIGYLLCGLPGCGEGFAVHRPSGKMGLVCQYRGSTTQVSEDSEGHVMLQQGITFPKGD